PPPRSSLFPYTTLFRSAAGILILVITAAIALVVALLFGGGASPLLVGDPGDVVRWGLPIARTVNNLAAAIMIGPMVLALFALRADRKSTRLNSSHVKIS